MHKKILIMLLIILPINIKAYCTNEQISKYKALAGHVNSYYEFNEETKKFNIKVYNINNELTILNTNDNSKITPSTNNLEQITINNLNPGNIIKLALYPNNNECVDYRVRTIYVNLPYYNTYHNDPVCKNNPNQLCTKWANTSIYSYNQFIDKVKIEQPQEKPQEQTKDKLKNKYGFFDFLADYYIIILLLIIASGSYGIYVLDKKSKFDF